MRLYQKPGQITHQPGPSPQQRPKKRRSYSWMYGMVILANPSTTGHHAKFGRSISNSVSVHSGLHGNQHKKLSWCWQRARRV